MYQGYAPQRAPRQPVVAQQAYAGAYGRGAVVQQGGMRAQPIVMVEQTPRRVMPSVVQRSAAVQAPSLLAQSSGDSIVSKVEQLLRNREQLKNHVKQSFQRVSGGRGAVDINGLQQLRLELAPKLGVPDKLFGPLDDDYIRFDFDGTGFLQVNEVYKLVKFALYDYLKVNDAAQNSIPFKSKQQVGLQTIKQLGSGNQAKVDLVCDKYGNQRCLKTFDKSALMGAGSLADLQDEFEAMQLLACKNIARSFEIFQDHQFVYMVNEVYMGGDFTSLKQKASAKLGALTEDWWKGVFFQCFEALQFMHQQAVMHCDVKEPNLMLRSDNYASPQVVLIDFGISKAMTKDLGTMVSGTPGYMPPETMNTGKWYPGGDVFSLGVAIFQLMTDQVPDDEAAKKGAPMIGLFLQGCRTLEDVKNAINTRRPDFNRITMPGLRALCQRVLEKNMRSRPRAPAVLKDPWFGGMAPTTRPEESMLPLSALATVGITEDDTSLLSEEVPPLGILQGAPPMQAPASLVTKAPASLAPRVAKVLSSEEPMEAPASLASKAPVSLAPRVAKVISSDVVRGRNYSEGRVILR